MSDITNLNTTILVQIWCSKTKNTRNFAITGKFCAYINKYIALRPEGTFSNKFFFKFRNGKSSKQVVGINTFGNVPKEIALYLKLDSPELYTGHCFRRSSATILIDSGGDLTQLKRHGGWKSSTVAESYIDESIKNQINVANRLIEEIDQTAAATTIRQTLATSSKSTTFSWKEGLDIPPTITFNNCSIQNINIKNK